MPNCGTGTAYHSSRIEYRSVPTHDVFALSTTKVQVFRQCVSILSALVMKVSVERLSLQGHFKFGGELFSGPPRLCGHYVFF